MRKKLLFRSWLLIALMLVGAGSAWAKTKVGETTNTLYDKNSGSWTNADLSAWSGTGAEVSIYNGLHMSSTNAGWIYAKSLPVSEDAVVTVIATLTAGGAPGRSGSYDYLEVGGIQFGFNEQDKIAIVVVDGNSTVLATNITRGASHSISLTYNTLTGAISYTCDGVSGTATSNYKSFNAVIFGHYKNGSEGYTITPTLNSIYVSEVAPIYSSENLSKTWDFTTWSYAYPTSGYQTYATVSGANNLSGLSFDNAGGTRFYTRTDGSGYIQLLSGVISVPVTKGQIVTFYLQSIDTHQAQYPVGGNIDNPGEVGMVYGEEKAVGFTANANGVITITSSNNYCRVNKITLEDAPDVWFSRSTAEAELIELNFDEPVLTYPEGSEVNYRVSNTKIAALGGEAHSGDLMLLNTGVTDVYADVTYKGGTYTVKYTLTVKADEATYTAINDTYTITGPGKLGERVVNLIPKITVEFGENDDNITNITIVRNEDGIGNVATTLDSNGWRQLWYDGSTGFVQPVQGTFYTFKPTANGHLTVNGFLSGGNSVYLVDANNLAHVPSDVTAQVGKSGQNWNGGGLAALNVAPGVTIGGTVYQMAEKYEFNVASTGDILSQTVTGLANGRYTVVLQANACFTDGRGITDANGNAYVWNGSIANDIANVFVESGGVRQSKAVTAQNAGAVSSNGRFTFEVDVTDGTLTMGMNKTQQGTNWHTIQIESLNYLDASDSNFRPVAEFVPGANFANNSAVNIEADLEAGHTYYLYANIPSSNGVDAWGTYQLQQYKFESAWHFAEKSVVVSETSYAGMEVESLTTTTPSLTYSFEPKGDVTATIDPSTGAISNISGEGGALIVTATDGYDSDYYVVTVPYANKVWDFWGLNGTRAYPTDLVTEFDWAMNYETRTYDTQAGGTRALVYLNEPILTAAQGLSGENAAYIGETAGLVVDAQAKAFGLRANTVNLDDYANFMAYFLDGGENQQKYAEYISDYGIDQSDFDEEKFNSLKTDGNFLDKYLKVMLAYTKDDVVPDEISSTGTNIAAMSNGAVLTIPHVKAGSYIAIKWYRHSPSSGNSVTVTNAKDLDGNAIVNPLYIFNQGRGNNIFNNPYGWLEFVAAGNEGEYVDVTLQVTDNGWTHIKAIALSEDFYDTNLRITDNGQNSVHKTVFNTTEGADANTYSTTAYYTFSQNGVTYQYTLEDITGNIEGNYTINGGDLSFNQGTQGTATLVLTAYSNGYAVDRERLPIKVGAYGDTHQEYPYTWDFTNINTDNIDTSSDRPYWLTSTDGNGDPYYRPLETYYFKEILQGNELKNNKNDEDGISEFDELGIETPTNSDGTAFDIDIEITKYQDGTTRTTVGETGITFVVPDVPADATVYVKVMRTDSESSVDIDNGDENATPMVTRHSDDTTIYSINGTGEDVKVTFKKLDIWGIAVTNIFKEARMASASDDTKFYNSDCQPKDIDYSLTEYYTNVEMKAMYITSSNLSNFNYDRETAVVTPIEVEDPVKANTGLIVCTSDNEVLHPLFVPDVNTTARQNTEGNMLVGVIFNENTGTASTETLKKSALVGGRAEQTLADFESANINFSIQSTNDGNNSSQVQMTLVKEHISIVFKTTYSTNNRLIVTGDFKAGDVITFAGVFANSDGGKQAAIVIYDNNGNTVFNEKGLFPNVYNGWSAPYSHTVTLQSDASELYIGRASGLTGATATYLTTFTVTRPGIEGQVELVDTNVTIYTGDVAPAESGTYRYLFTNMYNTVGQDNSLTSDEPGFYRLKAAGGKLKSNRAYLVIDQNVLQGNPVKTVYLKNFFNDDPDDTPTAIDVVDAAGAGIDMNGTFYTISGVKIQGMPTTSGIYIQNGKKIMIK